MKSMTHSVSFSGQQKMAGSIFGVGKLASKVNRLNLDDQQTPDTGQF